MPSILTLILYIFVIGISFANATDSNEKLQYPSSANEVSYHAAIFESNNSFVCNGAIVGLSWVVTVVNCHPDGLDKVNGLNVHAGSVQLRNTEDPNLQIRDVQKVFINPGYEKVSITLSINNTVLLQLKEPFADTVTVHPIALPTHDIGTSEAIITGFGARFWWVPYPSLHLKKIQVFVAPPQECRKIVQNDTLSTICTGSHRDGIQPYRLDIGGPLVQLTGTIKGKNVVPTLYGLVHCPLYHIYLDTSLTYNANILDELSWIISTIQS